MCGELHWEAEEYLKGNGESMQRSRAFVLRAWVESQRVDLKNKGEILKKKSVNAKEKSI